MNTSCKPIKTHEQFLKDLDRVHPNRDWEVIGKYEHNKKPILLRDKYLKIINNEQTINMEKVKVEAVIKAYNDLKIDSPISEFLNLIQTYEKILNEGEESIKNVEYIFEPLSEEEDAEDFLTDWFDNEDTFDMFYDESGLPDEGVSFEELFLIGDKLYSAILECESEWYSEWSVRKNLPGESRIRLIEEIPSFELLERNEDKVKVRIK